MQDFSISGTFEIRAILHRGSSHTVAGHRHTVLPSYTALKPCALTAKSVVNHKASIEPLLTIGDGSMNPDNLERKDKKRSFLICDNFGLFLKLTMDVGVLQRKARKSSIYKKALCDKKKCVCSNSRSPE